MSSEQCALSKNLKQMKYYITNEFHGEWTKSTKTHPKQFSFINIKNHAKKNSGKETIIEKPFQKGYKFFYENYILMYLENVVSILKEKNTMSSVNAIDSF